MLLREMLQRNKDSKYMQTMDAGKHVDSPDSDFDPMELAKGIQVELEHTDDIEEAKQIAKDHLSEIKDYYSRLADMENAAKGKQESEDFYTKNKDSIDDETTLIISISGDEGEMLRMLEYIKKTAGIGHSFSVVVDPGYDYEKKFGFDGDGSFRINDIQEKKK